MKCKQIRQLLSEYMDNDLDEATEKQVAQHLSVCEACQNEFLTLRSMKEALGNVEPVAAPENFLFQVHKKIQQESGFKKVLTIIARPFRMKLRFQFATATALTVLIVVLINIKMSDGPLQKAVQTSVKHEQVDSIERHDLQELSIASDSDVSDKAMPETPVMPSLTMKKGVSEPLLEREEAAPAALKRTYNLRAAKAPRETLPARVVGTADTESLNQSEGVEWVLQKRSFEGTLPDLESETPDMNRVPLLAAERKMQERVMKDKPLGFARQSDEIEGQSETADLKADLSGSKEQDAGEMNEWVWIIKNTADRFGGSVISIREMDEEDQDMINAIQLLEIEMPVENQKAFYEELSTMKQFQMLEALSPGKWGETPLIRIRLVP